MLTELKLLNSKMIIDKVFGNLIDLNSNLFEKPKYIVDVNFKIIIKYSDIQNSLNYYVFKISLNASSSLFRVLIHRSLLKFYLTFGSLSKVSLA